MLQLPCHWDEQNMQKDQAAMYFAECSNKNICEIQEWHWRKRMRRRTKRRKKRTCKWWTTAEEIQSSALQNRVQGWRAERTIFSCSKSWTFLTLLKRIKTPNTGQRHFTADALFCWLLFIWGEIKLQRSHFLKGTFNTGAWRRQIIVIIITIIILYEKRRKHFCFVRSVI